MGRTGARRILITGASLAGPALAYWVARYGFETTVVERAALLRPGGYAIDIRGTAVQVVDRMGLMPALRTADVKARWARFLNSKGVEVGRLVHGDRELDQHVELPRGELSSLLFELTRGSAEYRFGDAILALSDGTAGVDVSFKSGREEQFDLVVSAEGLHSSTRSMVFGPENLFSRYLGYCFAIFTLANTFGLRREAAVYNKPGKAAALWSTNDGPTLFAIFTYKRPPPSPEELADPELQRTSIASAFADDGWHVPEMITAMQAAKDFFFDATMQIRMPTWSKGRVSLVGDAGYGPSFFSGQGTSMALVGAYVLAGALATHGDHESAFRAYEQTARPYVLANQALVKTGSSLVAPDTPAQLWLRNGLLRLLPLLRRLGLARAITPKAYNCLVLPDYPESSVEFQRAV
jgi:2-polyprenyl-6-methoxyphenol hydroxylase-like FAD-dependent oxidoreductase